MTWYTCSFCMAEKILTIDIIDINECRSSNTNGCRHPASCQNTQGSYRCTCRSGYYLASDQRTCKDINECIAYRNDCGYKAGCQNTIGTYLCTCPHGYYLDGDRRTCRDINECEGSDCEQNCINYPGGYNCSCYTGYRVNRNDYKLCNDIDECSEKLAGCAQICTNTIGGFRCSCTAGYLLNLDKKFCDDIDECKGNEHGCQHSCENSLGSYKCRCRAGFQSSSDGKSCTGKPCLPIYTPVNGKKTCSGYTTDDTCSFSCFIGYKEIGSHTRRCTASKLWSGKEMKCKAIHCPVPPVPKNGFIYSPCNTRFNSECVAGCNEGFYTNETVKLKCSVIGTWEHKPVVCNEIKVCEPNPCRHGGVCTTSTPHQFSCDCSNTGYDGMKCEVGVVDIPDYPTLVAGVPVESVEFQASPPEDYVILTPQSVGVVFKPQFLIFQRNATTKLLLTVTARHSGLHYVRYYLSGPSAAGYQTPQPSAFFVETVEETGPNNFTAYDNMEFPSGCHKLELAKCPLSNVTITAYSTSNWLMFGPTATTEGKVSLGNGNDLIPHSMAGYSFIPTSPSSLANDCVVKTPHSSKELIKHRILTKSFLKVFRRSLPKWLDVSLRGNYSSTSLVETDLKAFYLTGKGLREEAFIGGQPLSDDTLFSLLLSPDIDLIVNGDRVSFGLNNRNAPFSLAIELCGTPPNNVILQPSPDNFDVINQLSVMKRLRDVGWSFKIFSLQVEKSTSKNSLTMVAKFSKNVAVSSFVNSRVDFRGTVVLYVDNLNKIMDLPLEEKWVVELYGDIKLTTEYKVQGKITRLSINMPQARSYATFGGRSQDNCSRKIKKNRDGILFSQAIEENPFAQTELSNFVELDHTKDVSCFLSTILYTEKESNGSRYRETSDGIFINFHGNLKFAALRFDNLDIKLSIKNPRCSPDNEKSHRLATAAELSGSYLEMDGNQRELGIFAIQPDSVVRLQIAQEKTTASRGSFTAMVNILGFQNHVNVNITQDGLIFYASGKIHGLFDASATFQSDLTDWKDQRYTAAGEFETTGRSDDINSLLEKEFKRYSTDVLRKLQTRLDLSLKTRERAKSRLRDVKILREKSVTKMKKILREHGRADDNLGLAKKHLDNLLRLAEDYSNEIQDLDELCKLKQCPKICQEGRMCETCWEYVTAKKTGMCPATCHQTDQKRIPPLSQVSICVNEHCKRIHTVHSLVGDLLGLGIGIGGLFAGIPPSVSFAIGRKVQQFAISVKKGEPDFMKILEAGTKFLPVFGASELVTDLVKAGTKVLKGDRNILSILGDSALLKNYISNSMQKIKFLKTSVIFSVQKDIVSFKNGVRALVDNQMSVFRDDIITPVLNEVEQLRKRTKARGRLLPRRKRGIPLPGPVKNLLSSFENQVLSLLRQTISPFKKIMLGLVNKQVFSLKKDILNLKRQLLSLSHLKGGIVRQDILNLKKHILDLKRQLPSLPQLKGGIERQDILDLKKQILNLKRQLPSLSHLKGDFERHDILGFKKDILNLKRQLPSLSHLKSCIERRDLLDLKRQLPSLSHLKGGIEQQDIVDLKKDILDLKRQLTSLSHLKGCIERQDILDLKKDILDLKRQLPSLSHLKDGIERQDILELKRDILDLKRQLPSFSQLRSGINRPDILQFKKDILGLKRLLPSLSHVRGDIERRISSFRALERRVLGLRQEAYDIVNDRISSFENNIRSQLETQLSSLKEDAISSFKDMLKGLPAGFGKVANVAGKVIGAVTGAMSLIGKSQGHWKCGFRKEKCTKERFEYQYIDHPYTCDLPCEERDVKETIQKLCCSTVSCASFVVNVSCLTEKTLCKTARRKALEQISKFKANAAKLLENLDNASQNVSYWKMKREIMDNKVRSSSQSLNAYQDAERSLEKAFNVTVENQKRKWKILAKPMFLGHILNGEGKPRFEIKGIKFKVKVSSKHNATLIPINITTALNGTQHKQVSTVLDFTNLNRSLRSIAKEILVEYVGDVSRISRWKRSAESKNVSTDDSKFYTLQTFHRLCSEFRKHKQTLYEAAMSLYNLSSENQDLLKEETQRKKSLTSNKSTIFEQFRINKTKALDIGIVVNYDAYLNLLANDQELLEAKHFEVQALKNEFDVVHLSSKLLYRNWLATMESIFLKFSDECSGFDDCLKYTIDSLLEIVFEANVLRSDSLTEKIKYIEEMFVNLTRQSDVSVSDAVTTSWNILQSLENITGVENVCAQAPNITEHPRPFIELGINNTLLLTCNATGDSLVYQWKFNGKILNNQSKSILRINDVSPLHSGNYSCDVSNHVAIASSIPAVVVIGTPPLIVRHPPRRLNAILSEYATLFCEVKKDTSNISYQWWFNSFDSGPFVPLTNEIFSHLSLAPVKSYQEGWYFCNVSNRFGNSISRKSFVKVLKYSLPVPVAKLTLTVISQSHEKKPVFYKNVLAKILASRLVTADNDTQSSEKLIKELNPAICKQIPQDVTQRFGRTETCDWTFSVIGENVTSSIFNSPPSQQINEMIRSTSRLKEVIGGLGNDTNGDKIKFSSDNYNFSAPKNSLGITKISFMCPQGQVFIEDVYKCAHCPPGSYGTMENGIAICITCPRGFYQSIPGQISCSKCPGGFQTANNGAYDQKQCEDENKFFLVFILVNNYHGDVLVTANVSGKFAKFNLKPTNRVVKSKKWKTERSLILSAVDASTNQTVDINGQSIICLQSTSKERVSLRVLTIQAKTSPVVPSTNELENFNDPLNVMEDEGKFHFLFLVVNNYHGTVLVTTNMSSGLENFYLNATNTVVISRKSKEEVPMIVSAVDARTSLTVEINGRSIVRLQPMTKHSSLNVLIIKAQVTPALPLTTEDENFDDPIIVNEEIARDGQGTKTSSE
ncbi:uncharacterized protein LOC114535195 [Dendronephthya gigantea]|uniref:uncharacterized protein LOC114535195 n=1 Tax=Dendronephthya gigantea TaxID=151771 RepID=UPI00106CBF4D|nr:uncharacterized protein LOC114535195 [Dendronephthya gigantea]